MHKRVKELIEEPLKSINIKLDDVEYVKEGSMYFLRVIIDKEPYVDVDTCVKATEIINPILDKIENQTSFQVGTFMPYCFMTFAASLPAWENGFDFTCCAGSVWPEKRRAKHRRFDVSGCLTNC